ncbi:relaxase [Vallicoccus soli]|uniref:Relaxase n=1 Tax=Vallicoccus soli TaxID=2339232 RepID=A0A3A3YM64_9ACTN|nr:relaxase [Vallicoccus soli]
MYLAGPGRHNEHTEPHLVAGDPAVMAWHDDTELSREDALRIARELDAPRRMYDVDVPGGSVWHCSLSLRAEEGQLSDEQWAAIAHDFVDGMGFTGDTGWGTSGQGKAPCRWVAVRHGLSSNGNDHVHVAVSLVREDGTKASVWNDRPSAQRLAGELERKHGLQVLESRGAGHATRGAKPAELAKAQRTGAPEPVRASLARTVRGCAAAAGDEAEFVRRLRRAGLLARPRYASGRADVVVGYSVAQRPAGPARTSAGVGLRERPIWYGGGHLARDLTLPRLRVDWPDSPQYATAAAAEWNAAKRGRRVVQPGREASEPDPQLWRRYAREVAELRQRLADVPAHDRVTWAHVARETSGAFAAWSTAVEATPGPLAATADALAKSAQLPAHQVRQGPQLGTAPLPSAKGAALLFASAARGGRGTVAQAVMLRQLAHTAIAVRQAHTAMQEATRAQELVSVLSHQLVQVRDALPPVPTHQPSGRAVDQPAAAAARRDGEGLRLGVDEEAAEALRVARAGQVPMGSRVPLEPTDESGKQRESGAPIPNRLWPPQPAARLGAGQRPGRPGAPGRRADRGNETER